MSALMLTDAFSPGEIAEMKVAQQVRMQNLVRNARALALKDQAQWDAALDHLTPMQRTTLVHAVMHGDHCEAGRLLRETLQVIVLDRATQRAKDDIAARLDIDFDMDCTP